MAAVPRGQPLDPFVETGVARRRVGMVAVLAPLVWPGQAALLAWIISDMIAGRDLPWQAIPAFLALACLRAPLDWLSMRHAQAAARTLVAGLRHRLIAATVTRCPGGQDGTNAAEIASLLAEKATLVAVWAERVVPIQARVMVVPLAILLLVASQSWTAALALALTGPAIPLFMALIGYGARAVARAQLVETGALNRLLIDRVAALTDIRLLGAEGLAIQDLAARSASLRERTMKVLGLAFLSSTVLEFMAALGVAMVAVQMGLSLLGLVSWGGWGGPISPFGAIFVLLITPDFYQPLRDLASVWHDRAGAEAALAEYRAEIGRDLPAIPGLWAAPGRLADAPLDWHDLVLEPCPGLRIPVADGRIAAGEAVVLVAPSGAGKSSLLLALCGLAPVASGTIRMGGLTLGDDTAAGIRAALGWIPQSPRFPSTSLRQFLTGGGDVPDERLAEILCQVRAEGIVAALPQGLDTRLGETGGGVSGGEARRLLIARALLHPPRILLADEPTADLDADTAAAVVQALLALRRRGTGVLVATHAPALVAAMDRRLDLQAAMELAG